MSMSNQSPETDQLPADPKTRRVLYAEAVYDDTEIEAVVTVLREHRHQLMAGPSVALLERRVAALFGKTHGVMTNSGSSANLLALSSLELPAGSEVITPVCTFSTTVAPIVQLGLVPAFVDVAPDTFQISIDQIEAMITSKTMAMMVPNLIGNLPDWPELRKIANKHQLFLIEDSADTLGSKIDDEPAGRFADISTTSFYASHVVTCAGFGGLASFQDSQLAQRARLLRGWGRSSALSGEGEDLNTRFSATLDGAPYDSKFLFEGIGFNFLPSEVGAAFGLVQLDRLEQYIRRREENFAALREFFADYDEWFVLPQQLPASRTAWLAIPLIVRPTAPFSRVELQLYLEKAGIQTRPVFAGNILRHRGFDRIQHKRVESGYPNADAVMRGGILLGCHHGMSNDDLDYIKTVFLRLANSVSGK